MRKILAEKCWRNDKRWRPVVVLATLLSLGAFASSCGIPVDASANPLASAQAGLVAGTPQIPGSVNKSGSTPFSVYFIRDGLLYPVTRYINSSTLSVTAEATAALAALDYGPSASEVSQGITTTLSLVPRANLRLDSINDQGRFARVMLDAEFIPPNLFGTTLALAYAQIVYTLTSSVFASHIDALEFVLNGNYWPAYLPNGSLGVEPVGQRDYSIFSTTPNKVTSTTRRVGSRNSTTST